MARTYSANPLKLILLLATLLMLALPAPALADGLEVTEVRTDNYPRLIVRFVASETDGTPIPVLKPGQVQIFENGVVQPHVDFYSLRESSPELWVSLVIDVSGSMN